MSPGYPGDYGNNLRCVYTIDAQPQDFIMLQFRQDFHVEGGATKSTIPSPYVVTNSSAPKLRVPRLRRSSRRVKLPYLVDPSDPAEADFQRFFETNPEVFESHPELAAMYQAQEMPRLHRLTLGNSRQNLSTKPGTIPACSFPDI